MKQNSMGFREPTERPDCNILRVAFGEFSRNSRPCNFDAALADPIFRLIMKARAAQMVRNLSLNNQPVFNETFEVKNGQESTKS